MLQWKQITKNTKPKIDKSFQFPIKYEPLWLKDI